MTLLQWISAMGVAAMALGAREPVLAWRSVTLSEFEFVGLPTRPLRDASKRESWRVQNNGLSAPTNVELNPPPADSTTVPVVGVG